MASFFPFKWHNVCTLLLRSYSKIMSVYIRMIFLVRVCISRGEVVHAS